MYLVNKPLSAAGQFFSLGHYPPIYQQAEKGFIYFITLIPQGERTKIVPAYFVDFFFVSRYGIVNQPFIYRSFIYPSLASSAKSLFRFSLISLNLFIL